MQIGIVLPDGTLIDNDRILHDERIPLPPFMGFRDALIEDPYHMELIREKLLSVTSLIEIVLRCKLNAWFKYNVPIYVPLRSKLSLIHGIWLHDVLKPKVDHIEVERELHGFIGTSPDPQRRRVEMELPLYGRIDAIDLNERVIYEFKTTKMLYGVPKWDHIFQLSLYQNLYDTSFSGRVVEYQHGALAIFDIDASFLRDYARYVMNANEVDMIDAYSIIREDTLSKVYEVLRSEEMIDHQVAINYYTIGLRTYFHNITDVPLWRCAYCEYRRYCPIGAYNVYRYIKNSTRYIFTKGYKDFSSEFVKKIFSVQDSGVARGDTYIDVISELKDVFVEGLAIDFNVSVDRVLTLWNNLYEKYKEVVLSKVVNPSIPYRWYEVIV